LLLPITAFGLVQLWQRVATRQFDGLIAPVATLAIALAICNLKLMDEGPLHSASFLNLALIAQHNGDLPAAERYLIVARSHDPASAELHLQEATLRYSQGRVGDAESSLRELIRRNPRDHRPHLLMARILGEQGRIQPAKRDRRPRSQQVPTNLPYDSAPRASLDIEFLARMGQVLI
jgi:predicted Zn-dependent protease